MIAWKPECPSPAGRPDPTTPVSPVRILAPGFGVTVGNLCRRQTLGEADNFKPANSGTPRFAIHQPRSEPYSTSDQGANSHDFLIAIARALPRSGARESNDALGPVPMTIAVLPGQSGQSTSALALIRDLIAVEVLSQFGDDHGYFLAVDDHFVGGRHWQCELLRDQVFHE